jgi:hypothetical protein
MRLDALHAVAREGLLCADADARAPPADVLKMISEIKNGSTKYTTRRTGSR